jgi:RNA 2',3'-cyclic 3'-phosphodiesterase
MPRCFIAFPASGEAKKEIERLQVEIKLHDLKAPIKFTSSDDVHVTVEFLGDLNEEQIEAVKKIIARAAASHSVFEYILKNFDAFPDFFRPKVLVIKTEDKSGEGSGIQKKIHDGLDKLGLIINDNRSWQPHLTVGRVKAEWSGADNFRRLPVKNISWPVEKIILFESKLSQAGPEYFPISEYQLK